MPPVASNLSSSDLNPVAPVRRRIGPLRWELRSGAVAVAFETLLGEPDVVVEAPAAVLNQTAMVTVARVAGSAVAGAWLLRRYRYLKPSARRRDFFRTASAIRGFRLALALEAAGLPTPRVLAAGVRRSLRVPQASYLLVEEVPQAAKLARFVGAPTGVPRASVTAVAKAVAMMHERGFLHGDLTINNVLLDAAGQPWFIDLERARQKHAPLNWRWSVDDVHRAARHFVKFSPAGQWSSLRWLKTYCAARGWAGQERKFIQALAKRLRGKEATAPVG